MRTAMKCWELLMGRLVVSRVHDFTRLVIWQRAINLAVDVADAIPLSAGRRAPGLRSQAIRAAERIADAIAEGCGKSSDWELARYADIAAGSVSEVQSQLVLALNHGILSQPRFNLLWRDGATLKRMLHSFQRVIRVRAEASEKRRA